jgi:rRNA maturation endonuclease Nob1
MSREIKDWFAPCPKCKLIYLTIYSNGDEECTYCGYRSSNRRVKEDGTENRET